MKKRHVAPLHTGRIRLRLLAEHDLPQTLAWRNLDHIRRWFFHHEQISAEQHGRWFADYQSRDDDFVFVIEEAASGYRPIGQAAIYNVDWLLRTAEFGRLMIGDDRAAGRGLAQEATSALVALAFNEFRLREVHLEVIPTNARAIRTYEACGFKVSTSTAQAVKMIRIADVKAA
jgi:RimJ/RimL family protein N-acetyltransferase